MVTVVDSQGRGFCVEAKYSQLELSVLALSIIIHLCVTTNRHALPNPLDAVVYSIIGAAHERRQSMRLCFISR